MTDNFFEWEINLNIDLGTGIGRFGERLPERLSKSSSLPRKKVFVIRISDSENVRRPRVLRLESSFLIALKGKPVALESSFSL